MKEAGIDLPETIPNKKSYTIYHGNGGSSVQVLSRPHWLIHPFMIWVCKKKEYCIFRLNPNNTPYIYIILLCKPH